MSPGRQCPDAISHQLDDYDPKTGKISIMWPPTPSTAPTMTGTFHRQAQAGLKFPDGTPVTAASFVNAWN